jgi:hypothetical protein
MRIIMNWTSDELLTTNRNLTLSTTFEEYIDMHPEHCRVECVRGASFWSVTLEQALEEGTAAIE